MTDTTLLTPEEINHLMSRIDGDDDFSGFTPFELALLMSHLRQTGQLEFASDWYHVVFDTLVQTNILNEDGSLNGSVLSLYWGTYGMPVYSKEPRDVVE